MGIRLLPTLAMVGMLSLSACVTINIYFPAAAAEKAADKIIDDVWQLKKGASGTQGSDADTPTNTPAPAVTPAP